MGKQRRPITVAETEVFERVASSCMSQQERSDFTDFIAQHPLKGDRVKGTGGLRKVRWGPGNRGKSGGLRILYYYMDDDSPLYLITAWDKSNKMSLSDKQKKELKKLAKAIKRQCKITRAI